MAAPSEASEEIDWGAPNGQPSPAEEPLLQVGAYITNISDIDLRQDQFSIELLLWTLWHGDPDQNPSDQLRVLNGIYNGDIQRFERIRRDPPGSAGIRRTDTAGACTRCGHPW